jgi:hypothetical protein
MYDVLPEQWDEISSPKRAIAEYSRYLPGTARLRYCGLPTGVVAAADAGSAVERLESRGQEGLYRVPGGWVWSRGVHLDRRARIVKEISPGLNRPAAWWMTRRQQFFPRKVESPGYVFSMCGDDAQNLYHWTFDILPRLRLLSAEWRGRIHVLAPLRHAFHRASLEAAGFFPGSIISAESMTFYHTEELLAASVVTGVTLDNLTCAREIYLKVSATVPKAAKPVRLYISRARATSRRVVNEKELLNLLEPQGYQSVRMETLSLAEQLALFRDAESIIAPTGAALAFLHLCQPGTKLLILMPTGCIDFLYRDMAQSVGLKPELLDVPLAPGADPDPVKADIVFDAASLAAIKAHIG